MCPVCAANAALIVGSTVSTGGLTALGLKILRWKMRMKKYSFAKWNHKWNHKRRKNHGDGNEQVGQSEGSTAW